MNLEKTQPRLTKDTGVKFFKDVVIAITISALFWCVVLYGIYEASK